VRLPHNTGWPPGQLRTVREEPKFREQLDALATDHRRLDDVLAALYFALARRPEMFPAISGTSLSLAKTEFYPDAPALRIFFTYTDTEVHLLAVEFAEEIPHLRP
jgi:hypothetical protein